MIAKRPGLEKYDTMKSETYYNKETAGKIQSFLQERLAGYLDTLKEMVAINSFTLNRDGVNRLADFTAGVFAGPGFSAERMTSATPGYGDHLVLSRVGGQGDSIGCVSHLDTVFPPDEEERNDFRWRAEGNRVYGPGVIDIKGGSVMMLMVIEALRSAAPALFERADWTLLFDASEETESDDFGELCRRRLAGARACLVFEAGLIRGPDHYVVASRKGRAEIRVSVEGKGAHSGVAHYKGASAIRQIADLVRAIEDITDYEKELTVNVGRIAGGSQINRVPHFAEAFAEMRAFSPEVFETALAAILKFDGHSSVASHDGKFSCKTSVSLARRVSAWPYNDASDRLMRCWHDAAELCGIKVLREKRGGLSDGNFTWDAVPTIDGLGPSGGNPHCSEHSPDGSKEQEYVDVSSFVPKAVLNAMAIIRMLEE